MKKAVCVLFTMITLFSFAACGLLNYGGYRGEYQDMYAVAVNNIFGIHGYLSNGEVLYDPEIRIVETDDFGRTLFFYNEYYDSDSSEMDYAMAFVIMQKSEDGYGYYYRDKCYVPYFDTTCDWTVISQKMDSGMLEQFKECNDWNQEFQNERCAKVKISGKKPEGKLRPKTHALDKIIYPYELRNGYTGEDDSFCKFSLYCESDAYGRELHYAYGMTMNTDENGEHVFGYYEYAIVLNADGTCPTNGIVKIANPEDSHAIVNELKQNTHWNLAS